MIARNLIDIGMTPRIRRQEASLEVGPVPGARRRRTFDQRGQPLITSRVDAIVEIIEVQRGGELSIWIFAAFTFELLR